MTRYPSMPDLDWIVYFLAAAGPAVVLMWYVYRKDRAEKEPAGLLVKLLFGGVLAAAAAVFLEIGSEYVEYWMLGNRGPYNMYAVFEAVCIGMIEEGTKLFFLKKFSWKNKAFNYRFDGMVYAVFVSLGFAAVENVLYVFEYKTMDVMLSRAILTIPAHMSFAVYMGLFYSRAKQFDNLRDRSSCRLNLLAGWCAASLMHAFFDGALMVDMEYSMLAFVFFVAVVDLMVVKLLRSESRADRPIYR